MCALYIVRKRKDLVFNWVVLLIGLFISLCGVTHAIHILIFFQSYYGLQAFFEILTSLASICALLALIYVTPQVVKLTSPKQLKDINEKLEMEILNHEALEIDLFEKNKYIEIANQLLVEKNEEMERLNKLMAGREERNLELKKEEAELQKRKLC